MADKARLSVQTGQLLDCCLQAELNRVRQELDEIVKSPMPLPELRTKMVELVQYQSRLTRAVVEVNELRDMR